MTFAVTETRYAGRRSHVCLGCRREIDREDYTRTFEANEYGTATYIWCRDCRTVAGYGS